MERTQSPRPKGRGSEAQVLRGVEEMITTRLPSGWRLSTIREPASGRERPDAIFKVSSPGRETVDFVVEVKQTASPSTLPGLIEQLNRYIDSAPKGSNRRAFLAARYLTPRTREALAERDVSYGDITGNLRLIADRPGLFVEAEGATKDPWPSNQPLRTLRGRGTGRAVRAIVDFRPPYGVRELAERTGTSSATLSRVIDLLAREALLTKDVKGTVLDVDWAGTIRRWTVDYEFRSANQIGTYLEPRGLAELGTKLWRTSVKYAATGAYAAQQFAPVAPARTAALYVDDVATAAKQLDARPSETGANLLLVEPFDPVVFDRTTDRAGLTCVAPSQLAADLLTGPGREPSEGEELLEWMKANEDAWRA